MLGENDLSDTKDATHTHCDVQESSAQRDLRNSSKDFRLPILKFGGQWSLKNSNVLLMTKTSDRIMKLGIQKVENPRFTTWSRFGSSLRL